jgi:hypothetical protein
MLLDRHRVSKLVELSAWERSLRGPERTIREEDVALLIKAAYDDATEEGPRRVHGEGQHSTRRAPGRGRQCRRSPAMQTRGGGGGKWEHRQIRPGRADDAGAADPDPGTGGVGRRRSGQSPPCPWRRRGGRVGAAPQGAGRMGHSSILKWIGPQGWVSPCWGRPPGAIPKQDTPSADKPPAAPPASLRPSPRRQSRSGSNLASSRRGGRGCGHWRDDLRAHTALGQGSPGGRAPPTPTGGHAMTRSTWVTLSTALGLAGVFGGALFLNRRANAAGLPTSSGSPPTDSGSTTKFEFLAPLPTAADVKGDLVRNWGDTPIDLRPLFLFMEETSRIVGSGRVFAAIASRESSFVTSATMAMPPTNKTSGTTRAKPTTTTRIGTHRSPLESSRPTSEAVASSARCLLTFSGPACPSRCKGAAAQGRAGDLLSTSCRCIRRSSVHAADPQESHRRHCRHQGRLGKPAISHHGPRQREGPSSSSPLPR